MKRWAGRGVALLLLLPPLCLVVAAVFTPLPAELRDRARYAESVRFLDRDGGLLREVRADDASRARWVALAEVGRWPALCVLAAEDRHFYAHPGVDPWAVLRAMVGNVTRARVVSGASTLTMQLARLVRPHPRTLAGKFGEAALALRIEASLSKREILEEYLNRAPFGPGVRGLDAASRRWFDKPPKELSLAEAAALAAMPRGPSVYDLKRHPERVRRRRDRVLDRMVEAGWLPAHEASRAKAEPLMPVGGGGGFGAPQFVQAVREGVWGPAGGGDVRTTIDRRVQREAELAAHVAVEPLASRHVTAAAVVVLDNASREILAYVGSHDFFDRRSGGQNDGVRAKRQPGSTLKPFVYAAAMRERGFTATTWLPDVELQLPASPGGAVYSPRNYDERFHGPVRLREALGSSLNVPAVWTANELGADRVLAQLHEVGFDSLDKDADWYGPAIALGDGEVTLLELANAYATLARGGMFRPVVARAGAEASAERRALPADVAAEITDTLRDRHARLAAFGARSALELPFDVAVKTGTSKGWRDNWTVGFTREVTVAVWVGNFDGSPMREVSGVTGAAPLFRDVMESTMRGRPRGPLVDDDALERVEVCALSGGLPTPACPRRIEDRVRRGARGALTACAMHERVRIDPKNGLRAGPGCAAEVRTFERFDGALRAWAHGARRDVAPDRFSPRCPAPVDAGGGSLRIAAPLDGARFLIDPGRPASTQSLAVRVEAPEGVARVDLFVDGRRFGRATAPFVFDWPLAPGDHALRAEASGWSGEGSRVRASGVVHVRVE